MDAFKKHFEKILLAEALLLLIGVAVYLVIKVSELSAEVQSGPLRPKPKGKPVPPSDTSPYAAALQSLQSPATWDTNLGNPFRTEATTIIVVETNVVVAPPSGPPIALTRIIRQPFKLIFKSYKGDGESFQINFLTQNRSFFVGQVGDKIADRFLDTGYQVAKFEKKITSVYNPSLGVTNEVDVSELTIQRRDDSPILLTLGKVAEEKEPLAEATCITETHTLALKLRKGEKFLCGAATYNVVDITPTQVIIEETKSKEKHTISLPGARE
jgi:hypothetical protein